MKKLLCCALAGICFFSLTACNTTTKTTEVWAMSDEAKAIQTYLTGHDEMTEAYWPTWKSQIEARTGQTFPELQKPTTNALSNEKVLDSDVYYLSHENYDSIVFYLHGGAYVEQMLEAHVKLCDKLSTELNAKVCMPLYPLAYQATWGKTYELLDVVYTSLLTENKPIYIMGDSAGGGLSLGYTEYLKDLNRKTPNKMVLLSPWLDVTLSNPEIANYEAVDLTLSSYGTIECGKMWAGTTSRTDYRISPIYGDLNNLPDTLIFVGTHEIIYPDVQKFYDNVQNTNIKLVKGEGLWHVFPIYSAIPEQTKALNMIKSFCK